jgi:hypothetical protein
MFFSIRQWCRGRLLLLTYCALTLWASLDGPAYALVVGNIASDSSGCQQGEDDDDFVAPTKLGARGKGMLLQLLALNGPTHPGALRALPPSQLDDKSLAPSAYQRRNGFGAPLLC